MRKFLFIFLAVVVLAVSALAQDAGTAPVKKSTRAAKVASAPKSDAEVAKCINDKFAASSAIKNGKASVSGGVATLTGEVMSGGSKGGQSRAAKACGAASVTNNITVIPKAGKAASTEKPKN